MTAAMSAPTSRSRQRTRRAVASRKPSQNTPTFSTSEISTASMVAPTPVSRCPAPPATPDRNVVTMNPMQTVSSSARDQTCDMGKPGRLLREMPQTSQSAFCIALATPRAPNSRKMAPMTRGRPVPGIDPSCVVDLLADHRVLREGRVRQGLLQRRVVLEHDIQDRGQHEQQREDRDEAVVGDERGQVPRLVVVELLPDRDRESQHRCRCWKGVGRATGPFGRAPGPFNRVHMPRLPGRGALIRPGQSAKARKPPARGRGTGRPRTAAGRRRRPRRRHLKRPRCRRDRTGRRNNAARAATTMSR